MFGKYGQRSFMQRRQRLTIFLLTIPDHTWASPELLEQPESHNDEHHDSPGSDRPL